MQVVLNQCPNLQLLVCSGGQDNHRPPPTDPTTAKISLLRTSPPSLGGDTLGLGTPATLWGWALEGDCGVGLQGEGTLGRLWDSGVGDSGALRGHSRVGHRETLGWAGVPWHSRDTPELGTPGTLWGWAIQG